MAINAQYQTIYLYKLHSTPNLIKLPKYKSSIMYSNKTYIQFADLTSLYKMTAFQPNSQSIHTSLNKSMVISQTFNRLLLTTVVTGIFKNYKE